MLPLSGAFVQTDLSTHQIDTTVLSKILDDLTLISKAALNWADPATLHAITQLASALLGYKITQSEIGSMAHALKVIGGTADDVRSLQATLAALQLKHRSLSETYSRLCLNYEQLIRDHAKLQAENEKLKTSIQHVTTHHEHTQEATETLVRARRNTAEELRNLGIELRP